MKIIKEIIVVEGRDDITAVKRAVNAEVIAVHGFSVKKNLERIQKAYENRGIIILTDPDFAGLQIRRIIKSRFPLAKQAYINRWEGKKDGDIGVENASPEAIIRALEMAKCETVEASKIFTVNDLIENNLTGHKNSKFYREKLGEKLGIGYSNGKQLLSKLNNYGITREEFENAVKSFKKKKVAFVCVHNSCRSQIAEALGKLYGNDVFESYSAGTEIKNQINQDAVKYVKEIYNIHMEEEGQKSKLLSDIPNVDIVITMGCNVNCPYLPCEYREDWGLEDPSGKSKEEFYKTIKLIEEKILSLKEKIEKNLI